VDLRLGFPAASFNLPLSGEETLTSLMRSDNTDIGLLRSLPGGVLWELIYPPGKKALMQRVRDIELGAPRGLRPKATATHSQKHVR